MKPQCRYCGTEFEKLRGSKIPTHSWPPPTRQVCKGSDAGNVRVPMDTLAECCGYHPRSKSFTNALGRLRTIEAAEGYDRDGGVKASDVFFE